MAWIWWWHIWWLCSCYKTLSQCCTHLDYSLGEALKYLSDALFLFLWRHQSDLFETIYLL
jgi:hypothetical protein